MTRCEAIAVGRLVRAVGWSPYDTAVWFTDVAKALSHPTAPLDLCAVVHCARLAYNAPLRRKVQP